MAARVASKLLQEFGGRSTGSGQTLKRLLRPAIPCTPSSSSRSDCVSSRHQGDLHHATFHRFSVICSIPSSSDQIFSPPAILAGAASGARSASPRCWGLLGGNLLLPGTSGVGWDTAVARSVAAFSRVAPPPPTPPPKISDRAGESSKISPQKPQEKKRTEEKTLTAKIKDLFLALEEVPLVLLGLGLGGAIPFVSLTPGIASLLPLPDALSVIHTEAQAAYGAAILAFLGGPHWGLAMAGTDWSQTSKFSKGTVNNVRYIWSVVPSLVAWSALLLSPVPKLAVLASSFVVVLGVDAAFARHGLLPTWYMPMRYLLTGIATLSLTSSLIVTAAGSVVPH